MFYEIWSGSANDHADICSFLVNQVGVAFENNDRMRRVAFEDKADEFTSAEELLEYLQGFVTLEVPQAFFIDPREA